MACTQIYNFIKHISTSMLRNEIVSCNYIDIDHCDRIFNSRRKVCEKKAHEITKVLQSTVSMPLYLSKQHPQCACS